MSMTKILENRVRRMASRQGLFVSKSARRDPHAIDFGLYAIFKVIIPGDHRLGNDYKPIMPMKARHHYCWTLDQVRDYLQGTMDHRAATLLGVEIDRQ